MNSVDDVAAAVLDRTGQVTTWKLQKLLYYSQAWFLVRYDRKLFDDAFEAWAQGPVVRSIYDQHKTRNRVEDWPAGDPANLDRSEESVIEWVVRKYGRLSAETLSEMTHAEVPWFVARGGLPPVAPSRAEIDPAIIRSFYSRLEATPDAAVSQAVANSSLEGIEVGAEWEQRLREVAEGELSADDLVAQEVLRVRGD